MLKKISITILYGALIFFFILSTVCYSQEDSHKFPVLRGKYLGQKPPGMKPEVFAPGIISTNHSEGCSGFTKDGNLFLFSRYRYGILIMEKKNGIWGQPYQAPFSTKDYDGDFMVAPDGKKIFIASGRPLTKGAQPTSNHNIWIVERTSTGWSKPRPLDPPVNTDWHESYPSVTNDGTLYFFKRFKDPGGQADIYRTRLVGGKYTRVENVGGIINTRYNDLDAFVAPDESFMIFCSDRPGGYGKSDFYISFRKNGNSWTNPVNMGKKINSAVAEWVPYVTPDGKYFFFISNKSGNWEIYWVDAKIIEIFKPKEIR